MKNVKLREWNDLKKAEKEKAKEKELNNLIQGEIDLLTFDLDKGLISEEKYYGELGCSKYYAESTSWFVPSCYYEKNREALDSKVNFKLKDSLYDGFGDIVYL